MIKRKGGVKMKYKRRDPKEKARIVLEYLTTHNTAEICNKYGIHQNQLFLQRRILWNRWKDEFLNNAHRAFSTIGGFTFGEEANGVTRREQKLLKEIQELKSIIGELTLELKKTENELY